MAGALAGVPHGREEAVGSYGNLCDLWGLSIIEPSLTSRGRELAEAVMVREAL